ncbi:tail fiber assembly protein [Citrobacter sp. Cb004]|uniref:tail fiber assembly protein n=1 Tax=Citrobacter sp. Cb004 TaxID=2985006 RepID=UPI0025782563|nr:tail fiber assembly protein [Citrobacter sp. Cb004]MDM3358712.1 tail fiber assembly protein [Citrobacter sp. Cb004]
MMDMKNFVISSPETEDEEFLAKHGAIILRDEQGREWYSSQRLFGTNTVKIMYDSDNVVRSITTDVSTLYPHQHSVAEVEEISDEVDIFGGWIYSDGYVVKNPSQPDAESQPSDESEKLRLRALADSEIEWLQDAVNSGIATEEESVLLDKWREYRIQLMRVDTENPIWPKTPND